MRRHREISDLHSISFHNPLLRRNAPREQAPCQCALARVACLPNVSFPTACTKLRLSSASARLIVARLVLTMRRIDGVQSRSGGRRTELRQRHRLTTKTRLATNETAGSFLLTICWPCRVKGGHFR